MLARPARYSGSNSSATVTSAFTIQDLKDASVSGADQQAKLCSYRSAGGQLRQLSLLPIDLAAAVLSAEMF